MQKRRDVLGLSMAAIAAVAILAIIFWVKLQESYEPGQNPNERWVSDRPDISFVVFDEEKNRSYGCMTINGETIEILPLFDYGDKLHILNWPVQEPGVTQNADHMICGDCIFFKDYFVMTIDLDRDGLLTGIGKITFRKEYINND